MIERIEAMIHEILQSREFKDLIYIKVLEKFGPELAKTLPADIQPEGSAETVTGLDAMLTPDGLSWLFRSKLSRRPNSQESLPDLAAQFQSLIKSGVPAEKIKQALIDRGRDTEPIWKFIERFSEWIVAAKKKSGMEDRAAETRRKHEAADGIPVDTRRLSRSDPRFSE